VDSTICLVSQIDEFGHAVLQVGSSDYELKRESIVGQ
jgi:hypothetical protein